MPAARPAAPVAADSLPPWRNVANVLLIFHLFALGVAVVVNAGSGKSFFGQSLRNLPVIRHYLKLSSMDLAYDFELSGTKPENGLFELRLHRQPPPGVTDLGEPIAVMPSADVGRGIRRQRFQQLGFNVAFFDRAFVDDADLRTALPLAIAERWIAELDLPRDSYVLVCQALPAKRLPKAIEQASVKLKEGTKATADPNAPPPPIVIHLVWESDEGRYLGTRPAPPMEMSEVVAP